MDYSKKIAKAALDINAIKLNPDNPFTWASGYRMPIYNDNRMFLFNPEHRNMLKEGFKEILDSENLDYDVIAGTSTAGISPATTLADYMKKPLVYVRDKPKSHGMNNQIEGIDSNSNLNNMEVLLIEDLISTGGSSARAVQTLRDLEGICNNCLSIFSYGLDKATQKFNSMEPTCKAPPLLTYNKLLETAKETGYISNQQERMLNEWREDPFNWGEKHGFPKIEK